MVLIINVQHLKKNGFTKRKTDNGRKFRISYYKVNDNDKDNTNHKDEDNDKIQNKTKIIKLR